MHSFSLSITVDNNSVFFAAELRSLESCNTSPSPTVNSFAAKNNSHYVFFFHSTVVVILSPHQSLFLSLFCHLLRPSHLPHLKHSPRPLSDNPRAGDDRLTPLSYSPPPFSDFPPCRAADKMRRHLRLSSEQPLTRWPQQTQSLWGTPLTPQVDFVQGLCVSYCPPFWSLKSWGNSVQFRFE